MQWVIIPISDHKIITAHTTVLKNIPDTLSFAPSHPPILNNRAKIFLALRKFPTTAGKLSSYAAMILTRYLNDVTKFNIFP